MSDRTKKTLVSANLTVMILSSAAEELQSLMSLFISSGYNVLEANNVEEAKQLLESSVVDLVIFEARHLGEGPFEVCLKLYEVQHVPLIFIAESEGALEEIIALEAGADAFIRKPADTRLLLAKSKALLRRHAKERPPVYLPHYNEEKIWRLDSTLQIVTSPSGQTVSLAPVQVKLFSAFVESPGMLHTQESLSAFLGAGDFQSRHVVTSLARLRRKLASIADKDPIQTVRGAGYTYAP